VGPIPRSCVGEPIPIIFGNNKPKRAPKPSSFPQRNANGGHGDGPGRRRRRGYARGNSSSLVDGRGAYADCRSVRASVTGHRRIVPPQPGSTDRVGFVRCFGFFFLVLVVSWSNPVAEVYGGGARAQGPWSRSAAGRHRHCPCKISQQSPVYCC
jgi:hypothetical protein